MKRILLYSLTLVLLYFSPAFAQRTPVATEAFSGTLSNWAQSGNTGFTNVIISGGKITASGSQHPNNAAAIRWTGAGTFTDDQYAKIVISSLSFGSSQNFVGVTCRASGVDGTRTYYYFYVEASAASSPYAIVLGKFINGTNTQLQTGSTAFANGDTIELECEGTTLRGMKNGTALGGVWTKTDSSITTGKPGATTDGSSSPFGDDWEGGNYSAGGGGGPAPNATVRRRIQ